MNNIDDSVAKELLEVQRTLGWMDLVIGSIDDAVYVTDEHSRIVFANQYFSDILNIPRVFMLGQQITDIFDVTLDTTLSAELVDMNAKSEEEASIYRWKVSNNRRIFKISKRHIPTTKQTVHLAKDITREQELADMKNSFINLASHQLRTPMTSIMLHAHILKEFYDGKQRTTQPKLVSEAITRSAERMISLINDILNITRIQNESLYKTNSDSIDLSKIIDAVQDEHCEQIQKKGISLSVSVSPAIQTFKSDSSAVHEIIANLLTNAAQYTPRSGTITIIAERKDETICITVRDTGIGIPSSAMSKIYDQFARADNAFETFNEGTGLGLYLVKLLLMKIDGTIECKSKVNVGTTFIVKIPHIE